MNIFKNRERIYSKSNKEYILNLVGKYHKNIHYNIFKFFGFYVRDSTKLAKTYARRGIFVAKRKGGKVNGF